MNGTFLSIEQMQKLSQYESVDDATNFIANVKGSEVVILKELKDSIKGYDMVYPHTYSINDMLQKMPNVINVVGKEYVLSISNNGEHSLVKYENKADPKDLLCIFENIFLINALFDAYLLYIKNFRNMFGDIEIEPGMVFMDDKANYYIVVPGQHDLMVIGYDMNYYDTLPRFIIDYKDELTELHSKITTYLNDGELIWKK